MEVVTVESKTNDSVEIKNEERQRCEVWTRVMGYHRPVSYFNIGKKGEHAERIHFEEKVCCRES
ncbi:MAG: anaerobic ribonucleoside-triphosphate reductase [Holosporaceae bacterium]|jgi:anaerobic ribonucleoside-triphosphate reductase|nr:anaerobic ribonucleoside-triphosphate reductase [Holosporaceae bacterium]